MPSISPKPSIDDTIAVSAMTQFVESIITTLPMNIVTAEMLIDTMKTKLADLIERTNVINREYVRYKTRNYLTVSYEQMSAMDEYSIKWSILMGSVTFCACCVLLLVIEGRKKHEKV